MKVYIFENLVAILIVFIEIQSEPVSNVDEPNYEMNFSLPTRRILRGRVVQDTRPYMVWLRPALDADTDILETGWLCGGVIIDARYVLTSAACIEDARHFYVISGTHSWTSTSHTTECIRNGAKKAIWKCVPHAYFFDGNDFDNIHWMIGDIAVVKVEDDFNFERRIRGCDFIPKKVHFNNFSSHLERSGNIGSIAGWGSTDRFTDPGKTPIRMPSNSPELLETDVILISKKTCKKRWEERYHFIIDQEMICSKDSSDEEETMSAACLEREVNCKEMVYSDEDEYDENNPHRERRLMMNPQDLVVHTGAHFRGSRRHSYKPVIGGFCENDHGGPLVIGQGKSSVVIGIMSACLTKAVTNQCYGPFLYTSVYKYRNLIICALDKVIGRGCRKLLKAQRTPIKETSFSWRGHPDGPEMSDTYQIPRTFDDDDVLTTKSRNVRLLKPRQQRLPNRGQQIKPPQAAPQRPPVKNQANLLNTTARPIPKAANETYGGIKNLIMRKFFSKII